MVEHFSFKSVGKKAISQTFYLNELYLKELTGFQLQSSDVCVHTYANKRTTLCRTDSIRKNVESENQQATARTTHISSICRCTDLVLMLVTGIIRRNKDNIYTKEKKTIGKALWENVIKLCILDLVNFPKNKRKLHAFHAEGAFKNDVNNHHHNH